MTSHTSSEAVALIDRYLVYREVNQGRSPRTSDKYRLYLTRLVDYCDRAGVDPLAIEHDQLVAFTGVYVFKELKLGPQSRRAVVAAVRGFYSWLHKQGLAPANLAERIEYPKKARKLPVPIPLDAAQKLMWAPDLTTFTGVRDAAILGLLIGTGIRISGLVAMNVSDLVFHRHDDRELLDIRVTEKGDKERIVPVPDQSRLLVRAYLGHEYLDTVNRTIEGGDQVLFVSTMNNSVPASDRYGENLRLRRHSVDYMIKRYGEDVGIPEQYCHAHAFRHLFGTHMSEEEVDVLHIKALMGHEDVATTEIYIQVAQRKLREMVDKHSPISDMHTPVSELSRMLNKDPS